MLLSKGGATLASYNKYNSALQAVLRINLGKGNRRKERRNKLTRQLYDLVYDHYGDVRDWFEQTNFQKSLYFESNIVAYCSVVAKIP